MIDPEWSQTSLALGESGNGHGTGTSKGDGYGDGVGHGSANGDGQGEGIVGAGTSIDTDAYGWGLGGGYTISIRDDDRPRSQYLLSLSGMPSLIVVDQFIGHGLVFHFGMRLYLSTRPHGWRQLILTAAAIALSARVMATP